MRCELVEETERALRTVGQVRVRLLLHVNGTLAHRECHRSCGFHSKGAEPLPTGIHVELRSEVHSIEHHEDVLEEACRQTHARENGLDLGVQEGTVGEVGNQLQGEPSTNREVGRKIDPRPIGDRIAPDADVLVRGAKCCDERVGSSGGEQREGPAGDRLLGPHSLSQSWAQQRGEVGFAPEPLYGHSPGRWPRAIEPESRRATHAGLLARRAICPGGVVGPGPSVLVRPQPGQVDCLGSSRVTGAQDREEGKGQEASCDGHERPAIRDAGAATLPLKSGTDAVGEDESDATP